MLVLGALGGGLVGFAVGRLTGSVSATSFAIDAIEKANEKAEAARDEIDDGLRKILAETPAMRGKELEDAINKDFDDRPGGLPPGHPQLRRTLKPAQPK